ncbi:hypothetical protein [Dysgonomonas termitidis]|uniref:DUF4421 domain-containing protein n=1 Tax=Dysgonomonas termitidis TaxID=1516126 RepID=A0ABV9KS16_9BACT
MHKYFLIGIILSTCLFFPSCASILKKKNVDIFVYTKNPAEIIYKSDTIKTEKEKEYGSIKMRVPRNEDSLRFIIKNNGLKKQISVNPKISDFYDARLLLFDDSLNLFLIKNRVISATQRDRLDFVRKNYESRYEHKYRSSIPERKKQYFSKENFAQKGDFYLNLSSPFLYPGYTILKLTPGLYMERGSGLGFAAGFDYYYNNNKFINLTTSATLGGDIPFGCGWDIGYNDTERFNIYHITVSNNHKYKSFSLGYGISYAYTDWWATKYHNNKNTLINTDTDYYTRLGIMRQDQERKYAAVGFVLNGYVYFFNSFTFGIIYKPTFVRLNSIMEKRFCYEHQISFDMAFKIRLYRKK